MINYNYCNNNKKMFYNLIEIVGSLNSSRSFEQPLLYGILEWCIKLLP